VDEAKLAWNNREYRVQSLQWSIVYHRRQQQQQQSEEIFKIVLDGDPDGDGGWQDDTIKLRTVLYILYLHTV
jgi:hypothetical protein